MNIKIIRKDNVKTQARYNIVNLHNIDCVQISESGALIELKTGLSVTAVINKDMSVYWIDPSGKMHEIKYDDIPTFIMKHMGE